VFATLLRESGVWKEFPATAEGWTGFDPQAMGGQCPCAEGRNVGDFGHEELAV
jgi:hypothetical protein